MNRIPRVHVPDIAHREELLVRIERISELPLLVLAFVMVPPLVGPFLWDLSPVEEADHYRGLWRHGANDSSGQSNRLRPDVRRDRLLQRDHCESGLLPGARR